MKAIVREGAFASIRQIQRPSLAREDEVLVRVAVAGVCRTDLYVAEGRIASKQGRILGHECSGVVEEAPRGAAVSRGDRVTIDPMIACGACEQCTSNAQTLCVNRSMLGVDRDGAFAEFVVVPGRSVYRLPGSMPFDVAAYSEPVAAALAVFNAGIRPGDRGLVYGRNRFSLLVSRLLQSRGFGNVDLYDPGKTVGRADPAVLNPGHLESNAYDFAIETVATASAIAEMVRAIRPRGTLVLKSRTAAPVGIDFSPAVAKELTFRAVFYGSFREAIGLLAERTVVLDDLLGPIFPLDDFEFVFEKARHDESSKLFFSPGGEHVRGR